MTNWHGQSANQILCRRDEQSQAATACCSESTGRANGCPDCETCCLQHLLTCKSTQCLSLYNKNMHACLQSEGRFMDKEPQVSSTFRDSSESTNKPEWMLLCDCDARVMHQMSFEAMRPAVNQTRLSWGRYLVNSTLRMLWTQQKRHLPCLLVRQHHLGPGLGVGLRTHPAGQTVP